MLSRGKTAASAMPVLLQCYETRAWNRFPLDSRTHCCKMSFSVCAHDASQAAGACFAHVASNIAFGRHILIGYVCAYKIKGLLIYI